MGLDIALGVLVFLSALRGWFKGFLRQAITLGALVGCVFLADPMRDLVRPYARESLPTIASEVLDRLLWWTCAVVGYLVVAGTSSLLLKLSRRRTYGDPEPIRTDQGAGFVLGALKGGIVAAFALAGLTRYAPSYLSTHGFLAEQSRGSHALEWSERYHPADQIWGSPPVQALVARVKTRGMWAGPTPPETAVGASEPADATRPAFPQPPRATSNQRPRSMAIPPRLDPDAEDFETRLGEEMRRAGVPADWR